MEIPSLDNTPKVTSQPKSLFELSFAELTNWDLYFEREKVSPDLNKSLDFKSSLEV